MVGKWVITPIYPIYKEVLTYNPLILAIDPNFLGHPSREGSGFFGIEEIPKSPAAGGAQTFSQTWNSRCECLLA